MGKRNQGNTKYSVTRTVYKAVKKYDHQQFESFCTSVYKCGYGTSWLQSMKSLKRKPNPQRKRKELEMKTIIEIIALCGVFVGGMGWLMNRPARPKDPEEDREQMEYLSEWRRKHEKRD